jgi:hypothetical protein
MLFAVFAETVLTIRIAVAINDPMNHRLAGELRAFAFSSL